MSIEIQERAGLIDIGANLSHESFSHDLDAVIAKAQQTGIDAIVLTGTCLETSVNSIELAKAYPNYLFSTAGLHPHEARHFNQDLAAELKVLAMNPVVRAVGETGLDFNRDFSPRKDQEKAFEAQLLTATELEMPVFLHQRDAHERFLPILREYLDHIPRGVVHCFTGSRDELHAYLDLDMYIGITGWICDERRGYELHALLRDIPEQRLMLETDAPYLLPRSIRPKPKSRRNEPANLPYVLETVATCLDKSVDAVAYQTSLNARHFFSI